MSPKLKATLWILSSLTIIYVSNQYLQAQRIRSSGHTQHSSHRDPSYRITTSDGQTMRINEVTGESHYWSAPGGGWVLIGETSLRTAVTADEEAAREAIIKAWYPLQARAHPIVPDRYNYEQFKARHIGTPSGRLENKFNIWKSKTREDHLQAWYALTDDAFRELVAYEIFLVHHKRKTLAQVLDGYTEHWVKVSKPRWPLMEKFKLIPFRPEDPE